MNSYKTFLCDYLEGHFDSVFYHTYNDDEKWLIEFLRNQSVSEYIRHSILIGIASTYRLLPFTFVTRDVE